MAGAMTSDASEFIWRVAYSGLLVKISTMVFEQTETQN
jgi:hypothetical protein